MRTKSPPMIERAFEVAQSGTVANLDQLERALKKEGYNGLGTHVRSSPTLNRQLRTMCKDAWIAAGNAPIHYIRAY
jgi:hypothetical protein